VILFVLIALSFTGLPSRDENLWGFLLLQSVWYLAIAPAVIPPAWYLYSIVKRKMGSKAPGVDVGVIAPVAIGYVLFVLGPSLGLYPPVGSRIRAFFDLSYFRFVEFLIPYGILLGPFYIISFYLLVVRTKSGEPKYPEEPKEQASESEKESVQEDSDTRKSSGVAFKLFVLGYGLLLGGHSFLFSDSSARHVLYSVSVYTGSSLMVLSQVWYVLVGRLKSRWEREELKNTLIKYIGVPAFVVFVVLFGGPFVLAFFNETVSFHPVIGGAFGNLLVPVLFFLGPIYAALFYVYKMA
jgi:hypothetical protein